MFFSLSQVTFQTHQKLSRRGRSGGATRPRRPRHADRRDRGGWGDWGEWGIASDGSGDSADEEVVAAARPLLPAARGLAQVDDEDEADDDRPLDDVPLPRSASPVTVHLESKQASAQYQTMLGVFAGLKPALAKEMAQVAFDRHVLGVHNNSTSQVNLIGMGFDGFDLVRERGQLPFIKLDHADRLLPFARMLVVDGKSHCLAPKAGGNSDPARWVGLPFTPDNFELRYVPREYKVKYTETRTVRRGGILGLGATTAEEEYTVEETVPVGLQCVAKKTDHARGMQAGDVVCFKFDDVRKYGLGRGARKESFTQQMDRLIEVNRHVEKMYASDEVEGAIDIGGPCRRTARALWELGIDLRATGGRFYRKFSPEAHEEHVLPADIDDHFSAEYFGGWISAVGVDARYARAVSGDTAEARQLKKAKRFEALAASSVSLYNKLFFARRTLEFLHEMTRLIAEARLTVPRRCALSTAEVNWHQLQRVQTQLEAHLKAHGFDAGSGDNLNVTHVLGFVQQSLIDAGSIKTQLYGDGLLTRWGHEELAESSVKSCLDGLLRAHAEMMGRVARQAPRAHAAAVTLSVLTKERTCKLRNLARGRVHDAITRYRVERARVVAEAAGRGAGTAATGPQRAAATGREHDEVVHRGRPVVTINWQNNRNVFSAPPRLQVSQHRNELNAMKQKLLESQQFRDLQTYLTNLRRDYDNNIDPTTGKGRDISVKRANYILIGRAKAQVIDEYLSELFASDSVEMLRDRLSEMHHKINQAHYRLHVLQDDNQFSPVVLELNMAQHRHATFHPHARLSIHSSNGWFRGCSRPKATTKLEGVLNRLNGLMTELDKRTAASPV